MEQTSIIKVIKKDAYSLCLHVACRQIARAGCEEWHKLDTQLSTLLRVLTDGLGVEVEGFSVVLLDIVCISLLFEAFSFPTDSTQTKMIKVTGTFK